MAPMDNDDVAAMARIGDQTSRMSEAYGLLATELRRLVRVAKWAVVVTVVTVMLAAGVNGWLVAQRTDDVGVHVTRSLACVLRLTLDQRTPENIEACAR